MIDLTALLIALMAMAITGAPRSERAPAGTGAVRVSLAAWGALAVLAALELAERASPA